MARRGMVATVGSRRRLKSKTEKLLDEEERKSGRYTGEEEERQVHWVERTNGRYTGKAKKIVR
jgi:hypothetical protein